MGEPRSRCGLKNFLTYVERLQGLLKDRVVLTECMLEVYVRLAFERFWCCSSASNVSYYVVETIVRQDYL